MVDQAGGLGSILAVGKQGLQHLRVQGLVAKRGKGVFDRLACELVPEGHHGVLQRQHAATEAFLQRLGHCRRP